MKVLVIGNGGREHALAWKLSQSERVSQIFVAPGNGGTAHDQRFKNVPLTDVKALADFAVEQKIAVTVVGPEAYLAAGVVDEFRSRGLRIFGPTKAAAQLESSKAFAKDFMKRHGIPTAAYETFSDPVAAHAYVEKNGAPIVIKADGLAAGKGVVVAMTLAEAHEAIDWILADNKLGVVHNEGGARVVIEQFLEGEEASFIVMCDGKNVVSLATSQDHKRLLDGDEGPNTGGMGAYSPAPVMTPDMVERTMKEIIEPTMRGMAEMGHPFQGVFFAGLMITEKGPELIEYNVRFGDPECQVLMMRLKSDLLPILYASATGTLDQVSAEWSEDPALTVVLASKGYPSAYEKATPIVALPAAGDGAKVFHAGTTLKDGQLVATGGRVLNATARGATVGQAQASAYTLVDAVEWENGFCRRDIGWQAIAREKS